jgi:alpha-tubulin suppressor-like RCC1 family protein
MSDIIEKFKIINKIEQEILNEINFLYVFKYLESKSNVFVATNDDKIYAFGDNRYGVLGFGIWSEINKISLNKELCFKKIIDFRNSLYHVIARTTDGKVYCWGFNQDGLLGNGKNDNNIYNPHLNGYLSDKFVIDICCGGWHSLALTNSGEVYVWGDNSMGQIGNGNNYRYQFKPLKVNGFDDEKIVMISCGYWHSMTLTESGRVFSWGYNGCGQLGRDINVYANKPLIVIMSNSIPIKKISCGRTHSLMLSNDGDIYFFGDNLLEKRTSPKLLSINTNKFIDIAAHNYYNISIALSVNNVHHVWGYCQKEVSEELKETDFISYNGIFNYYFGITYRLFSKLDQSIETLYTLKTENLKEISLNIVLLP